MSASERKVLRIFYGIIKVNGNWRKRYTRNKSLTQMFGDLDILVFVRASRLHYIGHVK
jgi:hypothetical protein